MANEVSTQIRIKTKNREVINKFKKTFGQDLSDVKRFYKALYYPNTPIEDESELINYDNYIDDIGSKWCYLSYFDAYDDVIEISLVSAWSFPDEAFKQLYRLAAPIDKSVLASCTFRDEADQFVGAAAYGPNGYYVIEEPDLPEFPDEYDYDEDDYDAAVEEYEQEIDNIIKESEETCIENVI